MIMISNMTDHKSFTLVNLLYVNNKTTAVTTTAFQADRFTI